MASGSLFFKASPGQSHLSIGFECLTGITTLGLFWLNTPQVLNLLHKLRHEYMNYF